MIGQESLKQKAEYGIYLMSLISLLFFPYFLSTYAVILLTEIFIYSILAMSLNLLVGYLGYISLGHATFFAIGGYTVAVISIKLGIQNFIICLIVSLTIGAFLSFIFGFISMRVTGIYFLMITLSIGQMFWAIIWSWRTLTGGDDGMSGISRPIIGFSWSLSNEKMFFYFVSVVFIICLILMYRIIKSPFGTALVGINNDEIRMRALGYNTWLYKYFCYVIAGIFGTLSGVLKVYQDCFVDPSFASIAQSALVLLMVIIGGSGSFWGPIIGSTLVTIFRHVISSYTDYWATFLGIILILSVMFFPEGIAGYLARIISKGAVYQK